jgi:hypothetical protein
MKEILKAAISAADETQDELQKRVIKDMRAFEVAKGWALSDEEQEFFIDVWWDRLKCNK